MLLAHLHKCVVLMLNFFSKKWLFRVLKGEPLQQTINKPSDFYFQALIASILFCVAKSRTSSRVRNWITSEFFSWLTFNPPHYCVKCSESMWMGWTILPISSFEIFFSCCFHCCSGLIIHDLMHRSLSWLWSVVISASVTITAAAPIMK